MTISRPLLLAPRQTAGNLCRPKVWRRCLLALAVLFTTTCAPQVEPVPPRARIAPAAMQPSAVPGLEDVRRMSAEAAGHAGRAADRVGSAKSGLVDSHGEIVSLTAEVDRLRQQKSASEDELLALYHRLVAQEKKFAVMVIDLTQAEDSLAAERELRRKSDRALSEVQALAVAKEAEATQLRAQLAHEGLVADTYARAADATAKQAAAQAAKTAKAEGANGLLWKFLIGCGVLCALSIAVNLLQFKRIL